MIEAAQYCTKSLPAPQQLEYWNELICRRFTQLQCEARPNRGYRGNLAILDLGIVQLSKVDVDPAGVFHSKALLASTNEDAMLMHLQISGNSLNTQRDQAQFLRPGQHAFCNTTERYSVEFDQAMTMLVAKIPTREFRQKTGLDPFAITCNEYALDTDQPSLTAQLAITAWRNRENYQTYHAKQALGEALLSIIAAESISRFKATPDSPSSYDVIFARAQQTIGRHLADSELNQSKVAAALNISTRYLRYLFEQQGTTFSRYLLEQRLMRANQNLLATPKGRGRVSRIAYECGFNNVSHFARVFTAEFGHPPSKVFHTD